MKTTFYSSLILVLLCVTLCLSLAHAQDDVLQLGREYQNSYQFGAQVLDTLIWSCAYLLIYACALVVTLSYLQLFPGFDASMFCWIAILWLGGMAANYIGYALVPNIHFVAALIALPLIFGWSVLVGTRSFADLAPRHALRVSLVIALLCAPYFGPTWQTTKIAPINATSSVRTFSGNFDTGRVEIA